jgi:hypothetical protein
MDNDTAQKIQRESFDAVRKIEALRAILKEFPEATLCIDSERTTEPDGFHGRSYAAYLADVEDEIEPDKRLEDQFYQCSSVTTYGMMCVECGKRYNVKTTWTTGHPGASFSDWCDNE